MNTNEPPSRTNAELPATTADEPVRVITSIRPQETSNGAALLKKTVRERLERLDV